MRIVVATSNAHKVGEIQEILTDWEVVPARAIGGMPGVEEAGETFQANARLKAEALRERAGPEDWILADDSGLEVDALRGAPGVYSARFAGPEATDADNREKLIRELEDLERNDSPARFVCALAVIKPTCPDLGFIGVCEGRVITEARGSGGFGYDPLFIPDGCSETFGQLPAVIKHQLSHRARALTALATALCQRSPGS